MSESSTDEQSPTSTAVNPGPRPEPEIEPGETNPGGVDAVEELGEPPLTRDLDPEQNPAVEDVLPNEVTQPDDTSTEATKDGDDPDTEDESPA